MDDKLPHRESGIREIGLPDALFIPERMKKGRTLSERMNSILDIAEPLLGVQRLKQERAYIRRQGNGWLFITKNPEDTIDYPLGMPLQRRPRYQWIDDDNGIRRGYLKQTNVSWQEQPTQNKSESI